MKPSEFKPCPFCGSDRVATFYIRDGRRARCTNCDAESRPAYHGPSNMPNADERARAAWNTRAIQLAEQQGQP